MFISPRAAPKYSLISPESCSKSRDHQSAHAPQLRPQAIRVPLPASRFPLNDMIDLRYVKKLVEMLDESSVDSIEISSDKGMKIRLSKTPQQRGALQMAAPITMPALLPAAVPAVQPAESNSTATEVP